MKYAVRIPIRVAVVDETTSPSTWSWQDDHMTMYEEAPTAKEAGAQTAQRLTGRQEAIACTYGVFGMYGACEGPATHRHGRKGDVKAGDNGPHPFCDKHWAVNQGQLHTIRLRGETIHHLADTACVGGWHLSPGSIAGQSCPTCKGSGVSPGMQKDAAWYRSTISERLSRWRDGDPRHRPTCDELADLLVDAIEALSVVTTDTTEGWDPLTDGPCPTHGNACTSDDGIICSGEKV